MKIEREVIGNITVLRLSGKMLIGEGDESLREIIESIVAEDTAKRVLLDVEDVPYVDSAGLGAIVRSYTSMSRKDGTVALLRPSKRLHDLLSITKLLTVFDTYDTEEEALVALASDNWKRR